jgi:hypothetical protein
VRQATGFLREAGTLFDLVFRGSAGGGYLSRQIMIGWLEKERRYLPSDKAKV